MEDFPPVPPPFNPYFEQAINLCNAISGQRTTFVEKMDYLKDSNLPHLWQSWVLWLVEWISLRMQNIYSKSPQHAVNQLEQLAPDGCT